jgi:hypothetical protein
MAAKLYARRGGDPSVTPTDITDIVPFFDDNNASIIELGMSCNNGAASQGQFLVEDPDASLDNVLGGAYLPGHTQITWSEDASGTEYWLSQGRISGVDRGRGDKLGGDFIEHIQKVDDANVDLRLPFTEDWPRPSESDTARLYALGLYIFNGDSSTAPDPRPSTVIVIADDHLAPDTNTVILPAKTYPAGTYPTEVIGDCQTASGKIYGVVLHHDDGVGSHVCFEYIRENDHSTYLSVAKISDKVDNWDPTNLTAPIYEPKWDQGKSLVANAQASISGLVSRYGTGDKFVYVNDPTQESQYEHWIDTYNDSESVTESQAIVRATAIQQYRAPGDYTFQVSVLVLAEQIHLIAAGMSIEVDTAAILGGFYRGTYVPLRIVGLSWEPLVDGRYWAHMQLNRGYRNGPVSPGKAQPAATTPTGAPDCGDTSPVAIALGIDGAGWEKQDDAFGGTPLDGYHAANASASGTSAIIGHGAEETYPDTFDPPNDFSYWTGSWVRNTSYAPAATEEVLWRFNISELGYGRDVGDFKCLFQTGKSGILITAGAYIYFPRPAEPTGQVGAHGGTPVDFTWVQGTSYYMRWKAGAVTVWEVGDAEPAPQATGGGTSGTGHIAFRLWPHDNEGEIGDPDPNVPSTIEVETLTVYSLVDDPYCLDDPGDSPYYAKSDDPRFDTIVTDHGALTGLADDDHTQYIKDSEFGAKGRILVGSGAGTFDDLVVGSNGTALVADSTQTLGVKWDTVTGGSGPFEDEDTIIWKFISPANTLASTDLSAFMGLSASDAFIQADTTYMDISGGKVFFVADFGIVLPELASDPGGGDSQQGQVYYNTTTDKIRWHNGVAWADLGGAGHTHVYSEVPSGTINGSNAAFTLASTPASGTLRLYKNGLRQRAGSGNDYTLATNTITYEAGNVPQTGDSHVADYET